MAFLNKEYKLQKEENFDGFLKFIGLQEDQIKVFTTFKPTTKLVKNGDTYTYTASYPDGIKETSFTPGVQIEDEIQKVQIKTTYTVDGNTVTQEIESAKGNVTIKREYKGDELVATITSSTWDGIAKRYYKA